MQLKIAIVVGLLASAVMAQTTHPTTPRAFVLDATGEAFTPWGFNYDRDWKMRLIEDYWETEWPTVQADFHEMKALGANVVRVHLQFAKFMDAPGKPNEKSLAQLAKLTELAQATGLYLDLTGLACYRRNDVPAWYDAMNEQDRWNQQAIFWQAVARTCAKSPAIFVYDLMNEPVVPAQKVDTWLDPHELAGFSYVQFISKNPAGRKREDIAKEWVRKMVASIWKEDPGRMVTVGMLPVVGSGFDPKIVGPELSYISVHVYPQRGKVNEALDVVKQFNVGKPVVIEETFPLPAAPEEVADFIRRSKKLANGWISFYWGKTPAELRQTKNIGDAITAAWLDIFQKLGTEMKGQQDVSAKIEGSASTRPNIGPATQSR